MAGKLLKTHSTRWSDQYSVSGGSSYTALPGSEISFTTTVTGGIYLLRCDLQIYSTTTGNGGVDAGFQWNGTNIASTAASQTWARFGNGSPVVGASNIARMWVHEPGVSSGTTITAKVTLGTYSSSAGSTQVNYAGYSNFSEFYIMEFAPT